MSVKFQDFSMEVKAELNDTTIAWLHTWANETASQAKRNCTTGEDYSNQLKGSYRNKVDESKGVATIGSPMEESYWEEFGTGTHADTKKNGGKPGRQGWWIYTPGSSGGAGYKSRRYDTKEEAEEMAAYIQRTYNKRAVVTNGRKPNYTLEKAFVNVRPKAVADLEEQLGRRLGK